MKQVLIKIENIIKKYGDNVVLNSLSLEVREGEVVVIVGPSGCGKSTLLRCINGLEPIQGGGITFRGEKVDGSARSIASIRQKVGMVFQNYELFPHKTILENIMLSPLLVQKRSKGEVESEALQLLERVGLSEKRDRKETAIPDSSRAGRSSAWRSCGHCACTRKFCCLMR